MSWDGPFPFPRQNGKPLKFDNEDDVRKFIAEEEFVRLLFDHMREDALTMEIYESTIIPATRIQKPVDIIQSIMRRRACQTT